MISIEATKRQMANVGADLRAATIAEWEIAAAVRRLAPTFKRSISRLWPTARVGLAPAELQSSSHSRDSRGDGSPGDSPSQFFRYSL